MRPYHGFALRAFLGGRFLIRLCDLVWAPSGLNGQFCRLPGRGGCLGGPATKWGGRGRPAGHMAVPPAAPHVRSLLAGVLAPFFFSGLPSEAIG
jgi:hypothetical protein